MLAGITKFGCRSKKVEIFSLPFFMFARKFILWYDGIEKINGGDGRMEKLDFLIEYLLKERGESVERIPINEIEKKRLYRGLVNIREPKEISLEFLEAEDLFLQEELEKKGITDVSTIQTVKENYPNSALKNPDKICLWRGDITKLKIDCIVNPANSQGLGCFSPNHNCLDNQVQTIAGVRLRLACNEIMKAKEYHLKTGEAIITEGYNLPAKHVIHTVGPIIVWEVTKEQEVELANCYLNSLKLAIENNLRTISFPGISTGVFRFPKDRACKIAIDTVDQFLSENREKMDKVVFNLWDEEDVKNYEGYIANHS